MFLFLSKLLIGEWKSWRQVPPSGGVVMLYTLVVAVVVVVVVVVVVDTLVYLQNKN